jgi:hypothetical protein
MTPDIEEPIMKVLNIHRSEISDELYELLQGKETYRDQVLKEHIYGIDVEDQFAYEDNAGAVDQLVSIRDICEEHECGYFRLIYINN